MEGISIPAHFDGKQIILDEPVELELGSRLIVTVLSKQQKDEHETWTHLSLQSLANAYGEDEPDYTLDSIKELNPAYEGR